MSVILFAENSLNIKPCSRLVLLAVVVIHASDYHSFQIVCVLQETQCVRVLV